MPGTLRNCQGLEPPTGVATKVVLVNAVPGVRLVAGPGEERPIGYYQRFGVTAASEEQIVSIIKHYLNDDLGSSIVDLEIGDPDFDGVDSDIWPYVGPLDQHGIWFKSGRAFYTEDVEEG